MALDTNQNRIPGFGLGIDFGTSNTVALLRWPDGRIRPLLFEGSPLLPSAVFAGLDAGVLIGSDAVQHARFEPAGLEPNPKRHIDESACLLGNREVPVVDMIAAVLRHVASEAARVSGGSPVRCVLTHPANWGPTRRTALTRAADLAGLTDVTLVPEPTAAATYFTAGIGRELVENQHLVIYDLGGGTFDASLIKYNGTGFDLVSIDGIDGLGGLDFDAAIVGLLAARYADTEPDLHESTSTDVSTAGRHRRRMLWDDARVAKEMLSRAPAVRMRLPSSGTETHLTRDEFEAAVRPFIGQTVHTVTRMLSQARVAPVDVAGLLLVGGSSRIPVIGTMLHRAIGVAPLVTEQPELVVAEGALLTMGAADPLDYVGSGHASEPTSAPPRRVAPVWRGRSPVPEPSTSAGTGSGPARRSRRRSLVVTFGLLVALISTAVAGIAWAGERSRGRTADPLATPTVATADLPGSSPPPGAGSTSPLSGSRTGGNNSNGGGNRPGDDDDDRTSSSSSAAGCPADLKVPSVLGKTKVDAINTLRGRWKPVPNTQVTSDQAKVGRVLTQTPAAGTCADPRTTSTTVVIAVGVNKPTDPPSPPPTGDGNGGSTRSGG
jgi:actin-like ATPase involved in cell morphogenesis